MDLSMRTLGTIAHHHVHSHAQCGRLPEVSMLPYVFTKEQEIGAAKCVVKHHPKLLGENQH